MSRTYERATNVIREVMGVAWKLNRLTKTSHDTMGTFAVVYHGPGKMLYDCVIDVGRGVAQSTTEVHRELGNRMGNVR